MRRRYGRLRLPIRPSIAPPGPCECRYPIPQPVRIAGVVLVPDAYECGRCGRPTHLRKDAT